MAVSPSPRSAAVEALGLYTALLAMLDTMGLLAGQVTVGLAEELVSLVGSKVNL